MLPIIELRPADFCPVRFNYCLGLSLPVALTFWFARRALAEAARDLNLNLDEYLTARLAAAFRAVKSATPVLIFYAALEDRLALSVCAAQGPDFAGGFRARGAEPGYLEVRRDFIPQVAAPFFWYDGGRMQRLHPLDQPDPQAFYLWDMGDLRGNFLKAVDKRFYFKVLNDKDGFLEYSAVPRVPETHLSYRGRSFVIRQVFCKIV